MFRFERWENPVLRNEELLVYLQLGQNNLSECFPSKLLISTCYIFSTFVVEGIIYCVFLIYVSSLMFFPFKFRSIGNGTQERNQLRYARIYDAFLVK